MMCAVVLMVTGTAAMADEFTPGEVRLFDGVTMGCLTLEASQDILDRGSSEGYSAMVRRLVELQEIDPELGVYLCGYLRGPAMLLREHATAQIERDTLGTIKVSIVEVNAISLGFHVFMLFQE